MKRIVWIALWLLLGSAAFAQKETFDVVSYVMPKGWQKQQSEGGVQFSITDPKTGGYAVAVITRATVTTAPAAENFQRQWATLVQGPMPSAGRATMTEPAQSNGWDLLTGSASYTDGGRSGLAVLISASGHGKTTSAVLMTNTQQFQEAFMAFIQSLELAAPVVNAPAANAAAKSPATAPVSVGLPGLWVYYNVETSGYFSNGMPMLTAGYFRREYLLNPDGTYVFRVKNWSVFQHDILFAWETGTWVARGKQLTFTPARGRGGWWAKAASGRTTEWGARVKVSDWKLETVTYTFELKYFSGNNETHLLLAHSQPTERDGTGGDAGAVKQWSYSPRPLDKSLIDNPPGESPEIAAPVKPPAKK
ncbi:MAG: hypothetical protein QM760_06865 [Nibricoccus sp.]